MEAFMVIDIGGTYIKYAVMDETAKKRRSGKLATPKDGLDSFLLTVQKVVEENAADFNLQGLAISSPGAVDVKTGFIGGASAIPYIHGVNMTGLIKERTGLETTIENDANCAALAEGWLGAAKEVDYYICIVIGTGIGGSIVLNKSILRGASLHGGEFGCMIMGTSFNEPLQATWSLNASTNALVQAVKNQQSLRKETLGGEDVFKMAEEGDPIAQQALSDFYKRLAIGIYNLQYAIDPAKILIGGGISSRKDVIAGINHELQKLRNDVSTLEIEVEACQFGNDANLVGALFHFLNSKH
ncbi:ROK family protein [Niallia taxi]|uniref:ROK family protein n=1 Tax=Niallia taxi TaxID=2499688 RepID=UPI0021A71DC5|nr:ROK family protein [Niallia taxi]MCT2344508.1 ROK family protein [Niallia taxi]MDE5054330.1 ROK family protein [Niallia taxi]